MNQAREVQEQKPSNQRNHQNKKGGLRVGMHGITTRKTPISQIYQNTQTKNDEGGKTNTNPESKML